jgi:hypothetical protein
MVVPDQLRVGVVLTGGGVCGALGSSLPGASPGLGERVRADGLDGLDGLDGPELVRQPAVRRESGGLVEQGQSLGAGAGIGEQDMGSAVGTHGGLGALQSALVALRVAEQGQGPGVKVQAPGIQLPGRETGQMTGPWEGSAERLGRLCSQCGRVAPQETARPS